MSLFSSPSTSKSASAGDTLLSHSQQLRAEFTFLLRALDQCGDATSNSGASGGGDAHRQPGSIVLFSYALEVALTLVRFDVLLNQEERKLLVHAFDRLLQAELTSLHRVEERLHYCTETAGSLRVLKQRCLVLDHIDWFHVIAKSMPQSPAMMPPLTTSLDSPGASAPVVPDDSAATTPLSACAAHSTQPLIGPVVGEPLKANAARIYSNILVNGVIPASALPQPPSKQGTTVIEAASSLVEFNDTMGENIVVTTTDDFTVLAGSANNAVAPLLAATPNSPSVVTYGVTQIPTVRFASAPALQLAPSVTKWAIDAFTQEQCRGSNAENYVLTQVVPVTFPALRHNDVSFASLSTVYGDTLGMLHQLRSTLAPTSGPFAPTMSQPNAATVAAASGLTALSSERRTSVRDDEECFSLASTINDTSPANVNQTPPASSAAAETEHTEIVRRNVSSTITNKSLGLSRVGSQHSVDTTGFVAAARSASSNGQLSSTNGSRPTAVPPTTSSSAKLPVTPSRIDIMSGSPVSVEGPSGRQQRSGSTARAKEVLTPHEEFVYRIVQSALLQHDNRWSHLRSTSNDIGADDVLDHVTSDVCVAPALHPSASLANYSFTSGKMTQPLWMLASDEVVAQKVFSTPICQQIDSILDNLDASVQTLLSMKKQLRSEITLLCFRVVSTVVDLLLPAAECRGKALTMFYRKWVCDVYRVLCQEHLLRGFTSLVHRAKLGGGNSNHATAAPEKTEMKSFGSSSNIAGRISPPQTNSPQSSRVRANSSSAAATISAALGGGLNAAAGLFRRGNATPTPQTTSSSTEFGMQLSSATLRTSNKSFLRDEIERAGAISNSSFDALDESTSVFPPGESISSSVPLANIDTITSPRGPLGEEALDDATAVGSLFRTFRRHNTATGDVGVKSPTSNTTGGGGGSELNNTTLSAGSGGVPPCTASGSDSSSAAAHQPSAVAVTLFRSLHGDLCVPPTGCLGTRLMFTLLNGTDVTSFDFKDTDLGNTQSAGSAGSTPQHRHSNSFGAPLSPGLHQQLNSSGADNIFMMPRSRTNSAAPTVSPPITHLPASLNSSNLTPRPLLASSAVDAITGSGGAVSSTTSIVAMPHHHTFRYPSVRGVDDVRALYAALFHDSEAVLSPHDPLRAAITLNYAEFLALVAGKRSDAADAISCYLDEVDMEPIQPFSQRQVDLVGLSASASTASTVHPTAVPTLSTFSVTNVRRTAGTATGAPPLTTTTSMVPSPTTVTSTAGKSSAAAAPTTTSMTSICDLIPSWQNKDERTQFVELVGLLKSALATLAR
jgi:hypothetical protein